MTRRLAFLLPVVLFAVVVAVFAGVLTHDPHLLPSALIDRPVPDFALPGLYEGAEGLSRKDLGGRVTLVNFFASWCAPCREEHAQLMTLARRPGITLDGIAYKDKPDATAEFLHQNGDPYTRIARDEPGSTAINFGLYGVPETYLVDGSGIVRWRWPGGLSDDIIHQSLAPLLQSLA